MSPAIPAALNMKCGFCPDVIYQGEPHIFHDDLPCHPECQPCPPDQHINPSTLKLARMIAQRISLGRALIEANMTVPELDDLPEQISKSFWLAVAAENQLMELLNSVVGEHLPGEGL